MNRVARRAGIVVVLILFLFGGFGFFCVEYVMNSHDWIGCAGSPHVYTAGGKAITSSVIIDSNNTILLDTRNGTEYSGNLDVRKSTIHWVGDRGGNINVRTLSQLMASLAEIRLDDYNAVSGIYSYGDYTSVSKLSVDSRLQIAALNALGEYNGTVAVYNYKTGQILCAVSNPTFDPDNVPEDIEESLNAAYYNKFIDYPFAPGSIFKIVTAAIALETIEDMDQWTFECTGVLELPGYDVTCEMRHGKQNLKDAFCNSCNCAFASLSQIIGPDVYSEYIEKFGVADSLEFDGITTAKGNFEKSDDSSDLAWSAVGQHKDQIIPATFMNFVGTIANGGQGVLPYIVEEVTVRDEPVYSCKTVQQKRIMSEETARTLQELMRNNVSVKYGDNNFPGLNVCAKTGTAEVDQTGEVQPNAMFTGFVMDEKYPLAFIVCAEDAGYGRAVCVPIISKVLAACKDVIDSQ